MNWMNWRERLNAMSWRQGFSWNAVSEKQARRRPGEETIGLTYCIRTWPEILPRRLARGRKRKAWHGKQYPGDLPQLTESLRRCYAPSCGLVQRGCASREDRTACAESQ